MFSRLCHTDDSLLVQQRAAAAQFEAAADNK